MCNLGAKTHVFFLFTNFSAKVAEAVGAALLFHQTLVFTVKELFHQTWDSTLPPGGTILEVKS
jgi:hypothetical protein